MVKHTQPGIIKERETLKQQETVGAASKTKAEPEKEEEGVGKG